MLLITQIIHKKFCTSNTNSERNSASLFFDTRAHFKNKASSWFFGKIILHLQLNALSPVWQRNIFSLFIFLHFCQWKTKLQDHKGALQSHHRSESTPVRHSHNRSARHKLCNVGTLLLSAPTHRYKLLHQVRNWSFYISISIQRHTGFIWTLKCYLQKRSHLKSTL